MTPRAQDHGKRTVLIVDDDPSILELLSTILGPSHRILTSACALEAETILQSQPVQVILCDHHMDGEEGLAFLTRIAKAYPSIPKVLVTGDVQTELLLEAINKGHLFRFLVKPFKASQVVQVVEDALAYHQAAGRRKPPVRFHLNMANAAKLLGVAVFGLFLMFIAIVALGLLAFLLLYFFKSAIGIDLLPNTHLSDLL
jgi:DNA-binding NtrC family response regulator